MDKDLQAAHEMGKIYNSLVDRKLLCDFFVESSMNFVQASYAYLFLTGNEDKLWLESKTGESPEPTESIQKEAQKILQSGKPSHTEKILFAPLIMRNSAIGVVCYSKNASNTSFSDKDQTLACDLSSQAAAALKNIILHEDNLRMERLAAIGRTTSMVLHEVKNIIQLAKFSQEYIRMGVKDHKNDCLQRGVKMIDKVVREMDGFTYEMLSLTKDYEIKPFPMDLNSVLDELQQDLEEKAKQYNVSFDFKVEGGLEGVEGEVRSLYRAILNLVKNAIEASDDSKPNSYIRIHMKSVGEAHYVIEVSDNGQGMSHEVKAKLFQAFMTTKGESGTGLGLLIIDRTIKAHHGKIEVESEEGKGTLFRITLPKHPIKAKAEIKKAA